MEILLSITLDLCCKVAKKVIPINFITHIHLETHKLRRNSAIDGVCVWCGAVREREREGEPKYASRLFFSLLLLSSRIAKALGKMLRIIALQAHRTCE